MLEECSRGERRNPEEYKILQYYYHDLKFSFFGRTAEKVMHKTSSNTSQIIEIFQRKNSHTKKKFGDTSLFCPLALSTYTKFSINSVLKIIFLSLKIFSVFNIVNTIITSCRRILSNLNLMINLWS